MSAANLPAARLGFYLIIVEIRFVGDRDPIMFEDLT